MTSITADQAARYVRDEIRTLSKDPTDRYQRGHAEGLIGGFFLSRTIDATLCEQLRAELDAMIATSQGRAADTSAG